MSQGKAFEKIRAVLVLLVKQEPLDHKHHDHPLGNNWKGCRELHIEPDWLLIYKIENQALWLLRTGSHSELFG